MKSNLVILTLLALCINNLALAQTKSKQTDVQSSQSVAMVENKQKSKVCTIDRSKNDCSPGDTIHFRLPGGNTYDARLIAETCDLRANVVPIHFYAQNDGFVVCIAK